MNSRFQQTIALAAAAVLLLPAQVRLESPMDPNAGKQIIEAAYAAEQEGNSAASLRDYGRAAEFYPNEPLVRAPIYMAMSAEARKIGDSKLADDYRAMAQALGYDEWM